MSDEILIESASASATLRGVKIAMACALAFPLAILLLRAIPTPYVAQIKVFALQPNAKSSLMMSMAMPDFNSHIAGAAFLSGQQVLAHSSEVFNAVREVDPTLHPKRNKSSPISGKVGPIIERIQEIAFGKEYMNARQKWQNEEFAAFKDRLSIEIDLDTASLTLGYKHVDPEIAIKAVKTATEALQDFNAQLTSEQAVKRAEFLAIKIQEAREELDSSNDRVTEFIQRNKISNDPRTVEPRYKGFSDASELVMQAQLELSQRRTTLEESKKVANQLKADIRNGLLSDRDGRLASLTADLRRYEQTLNVQGGTQNKKMTQRLRKQVADVREKIAQELSGSAVVMDTGALNTLLATTEASIIEQENAIRAAEKQLEFGKAQRTRYEKALAVLPNLGAQLGRLTMLQNQQRQVLETLTQRYLEAQIDSDTKLTQLYVTEDPNLIDTAKLAKIPMLIAIMGVFSTLIAGAFIAKDVTSKTILTRQQLGRIQEPRYLGSVGYINELRSRKLMSATLEYGLGFRVAHTLKRRVIDVKPHNEGVMIAVTSKQARVGKTVTAVGIATALKARNLKTLVIDADYFAQDRSLVARVGDSAIRVKLSELQGTMDQSLPALHAHHRQKLPVWSILDEFKTDQDIAHFFANDFAKFMKQLKQEYDCIIVDCAPAFIPTMLLVYEHADALLFCLAEGLSTEKDIADLIDITDPARKEHCKLFSVLTLARLKANLVTATEADGHYYRIQNAS